MLLTLFNGIYQLVHGYDTSIYTFFLLGTMLQLFELRSGKNRVVYFAVSMGAFFGLYYMPALSGLMKYPYPYLFFFIIGFLVTFLSCLYFLKGGARPKFVYLLFYFTFFRGVKFVSSFLYDQELAMGQLQFRIWDLGVLLLTFPLVAYFTYLFRKFPITGMNHLDRNETILMIISPVSFFCIFLLWDPQIPVPDRLVVPLSSLFLVISLSAVYVLYSVIVSDMEKNREMDHALNETRVELLHFRYSAFLQEEIKKERHELKNRYFYIQTLMNEKRYDDVSRYLEESVGEKMEQISALSTGNTMIDYLLNHKIAVARKYGMKVYTEVLVPEKLSVNEDVLCTVLLNLLDNAIEASRKEPDADIHIIINCVRGYLKVRISNKTNAELLKKNPNLQTTKQDPANHGLGIRIIRDTVEKENGIYDYHMEENYFVTTVMLPL